MRVCILEDNVIYLKKITEFIEKRGHQVKSFDCIEEFRFTEADFYLMDLQIGTNMSYDLIQEIREKTDNLIIIISHHDEESILKKAILSGGDIYFNKMDVNKYSLQFDIIEKLVEKLGKQSTSISRV